MKVILIDKDMIITWLNNIQTKNWDCKYFIKNSQKKD